MQNLRLFLLLALLPAFIIRAGAQDYNINGDTIKVSSSTYATLTFMSEAEPTFVCSDYEKRQADEKTIIVKPKISKPVAFCRLLVKEGNRQHKFIIQYVQDLDPSEAEHDYSSKQLMKKRIDYLDKARGNTEGGASLAKAYAEGPKNAKAVPERLKKQIPDQPRREAPEQPVKTDPAGTADEEATPVPAAYMNEATPGSEKSTTLRKSMLDVHDNEIDALVRSRIDAFYKACKNLCNKRDIENTMIYAMKLFENNEDRIVATTNNRTKATRQRKIKVYLKDLTTMNYSHVDMTASDLRFLSKFEYREEDRAWHATAVLIQDFKGYGKEGILAYLDKTNKSIDVIVKTYTEERDGQTVNKFNVFFGNISVINQPA